MAGNGNKKSTANLRPAKTHEEAVERGRKGGLKSGVTRRAQADMREAARLLMNMPVKYASVKDGMKQLGIDANEMTNTMAIVVSMYKEAMSGNVKAAQFLLEATGNEKAEKQNDERFRMAMERHELEMRKLKAQIENGGDGTDGLPTIINIRPGKE